MTPIRNTWPPGTIENWHVTRAEHCIPAAGTAVFRPDRAADRASGRRQCPPQLPPGRVIVTEGEPSQSLYILLSGRAKVQRSDTEGKEVILAVIGPGECFGEMSLIDDSPRSASVITIDTSDFMAINKESFKSMMLSSPEMSLRIMAGLVRRLREADKKIETLALLDVYGRVARVLLDMSEKVGEERMIRSRLPRQEIAKMIGASREMVSRVMKGLETEGYIVPLPEGKVLLREKLSSYLA
ncbi:Crp/Fnr family transcriptional regulator [Lautropia mirabilis]